MGHPGYFKVHDEHDGHNLIFAALVHFWESSCLESVSTTKFQLLTIMLTMNFEVSGVLGVFYLTSWLTQAALIIMVVLYHHGRTFLASLWPLKFAQKKFNLVLPPSKWSRFGGYVRTTLHGNRPRSFKLEIASADQSGPGGYGGWGRGPRVSGLRCTSLVFTEHI